MLHPVTFTKDNTLDLQEIISLALKAARADLANLRESRVHMCARKPKSTLDHSANQALLESNRTETHLKARLVSKLEKFERRLEADGEFFLVHLERQNGQVMYHGIAVVIQDEGHLELGFLEAGTPVARCIRENGIGEHVLPNGIKVIVGGEASSLEGVCKQVA